MMVHHVTWWVIFSSALARGGKLRKSSWPAETNAPNVAIVSGQVRLQRKSSHGQANVLSYRAFLSFVHPGLLALLQLVFADNII
jgi:hypothetical protein